MKLKWKIIVLFNIFFIFFVSFKILQPEDEDEDVWGDNPLPSSASREGRQLVKILEEKYMLRSEYCQADDDPWKIAADWVKPREIIPENAPKLGCVLHSLKSGKILSADVGYKGTQLKLTLQLEGGQRVIFKPKWFERDFVQETIISGGDRHNGEIATFHLGRLLELRRTPIAVGRKINLKNEIIPVASERLLKTFFTKGRNQCFYGKCLYCKDESTGVCAEGDILEGVVILWLPNRYPLKVYRSPWLRSYKPGVTRRWESDKDFCKDVIMKEPYNSGSMLMDLVDATIVDYLIGNADRHHYETLGTQSDSMVLILDNGKSFGNPDYDEHTILAPLYQCCKIRESTWQTLLMLRNTVLSKTLQTLLSQDSLQPVLHDKYYAALDRRLERILLEVNECIVAKGIQQVITDTSTHS